MLVIGAGVFLYALLVEPVMCQLVSVKLPIKEMPTGLRILFLTDMHHHRWGQREEAFLRNMPKEPVDLIIFGGDFLGSKQGIDASILFVNRVHAMYPSVKMFGVFGNAEHKLKPHDRADFFKCLATANVTILDNENTVLKVKGTDLAIVGTDDPYYGFHDLKRAFEGVNNSIPKLLVTHSPQVIRSAIAYDPALVLSGHTHGGQVRIPGVGPMRTQNPLSRQIAMGVYGPNELSKILFRGDEVRTWLYVSRGLVLAFVPHMRWLAPRFLCRPEVTLLTIES